jgi:hypothetical protein
MHATLRTFALCLLIASLAYLPLAGQNDAGPRDAACLLPDPEEISFIVAEMYCHPFGELAGGDVASTRIAPEQFAECLEFFRDNRRDDTPYNDEQLGETGTLRIVLKSGGCLRICWFDRGKNRLLFSCRGRFFTRVGEWIGPDCSDETMNVDGRLRNICKPQNDETVD